MDIPLKKSKTKGEIKAIHSDDNVYLNTIVDEAIRYYYEYLKNNT